MIQPANRHPETAGIGRRGLRNLALGVALTGGLALPSTAQANPAVNPASPLPSPSQAPPNPWAATLELYGFAPIRTTGDTTVRGFTAETDLWLGDLIPLIQMTASARGSLEQGRFGLLADLSYNRIGDSFARTTPRGLLTGKAAVTTKRPEPILGPNP